MKSAAQHPLGYFDKIFVINLPSRTDRLREIEGELRRIGLTLTGPAVEVFPAIRPADKGGFESVGAQGAYLSHLGVLKTAAQRGYQRILIFEDDLNLVAGFNSRMADLIELLRRQPWGVFYGGYDLRPPPPQALADGIPFLESDQRVDLAHFVGFQAPAIAAAADYLETLLGRPSGDPRGGPMHVDGAYSWFRRQNPHVRTCVSVPQLGYQRASRTDIHQLRWFDRLPGIRRAAAAARALKNFRRPRRV